MEIQKVNCPLGYLSLEIRHQMLTESTCHWYEILAEMGLQDEDKASIPERDLSRELTH